MVALAARLVEIAGTYGDIQIIVEPIAQFERAIPAVTRTGIIDILRGFFRRLEFPNIAVSFEDVAALNIAEEAGIARGRRFDVSGQCS